MKPTKKREQSLIFKGFLIKTMPKGLIKKS
ncbi:hypothetical protein NITGR_10028 [Nitrospina gracilis 3/211]|uniref:Uncharacterized protein n=1 Tax=Nitrospina gracilis (strain 3/211) TaxID=1266370 RepID=M1YUD2_NITG3|nr:hypothetical protein NITGR_10028 [Nitrospina gracilis 3/211]